jgi:lysophospholipase L1-like esterase
MADSKKTAGRAIKVVRDVLRGIVLTSLVLAVIEVVLRIATHAPMGIFSGWAPGENGLYVENKTIEMLWGPIPYTIQVNSLGFRGDEVAVEKPGGTLRIAGLGDSVTDGLFVDDDATYPYFLQQILNEQYRLNAEVINAANGGGSIDKEYAIMKRNVVPLKPDITVLMFCTNDIAEIRGIPGESLTRNLHRFQKVVPRKRLTVFLLTRTAIGEFFMDMKLKAQSESYRQKKEGLQAKDDRYDIAGGDNFARNAELFNKRYAKTDGMVLKDSFPPEVEQLIRNYLYALGGLKALCDQNAITLVFTYFPAYPQIYGAAPSSRIQEIMREGCVQLSIPFLDLTPSLREHAQDKVLHLAPLDYHLKPEGNKFIASVISDFLVHQVIDKES